MTKTAWLLEFEYKNLYGQLKSERQWHMSHAVAQMVLDAYASKYGILKGSIKKQYDRGIPERKV